MQITPIFRLNNICVQALSSNYYKFGFLLNFFLGLLRSLYSLAMTISWPEDRHCEALAEAIQEKNSLYHLKLKFGINQKAFSLVELSIVLIIAGIIMAVVMSAISSSNNPNDISIMDNATKITQAVEAFEKEYGQLPGDTYNVDAIFSSNSANGDPANTKGNGDGFVTSNEGIYAFQHMVFAGFLSGNYNGTWTYKTMYKGPMPRSIFYLLGGYSDPVVLRFSGAIYTNETDALSGTNLTGAALSVKDMISIDTKYDDGSPQTGLIRAYDGSNTAPNSCVTVGGAYNSSNISNETPKCYFDLRIKRGIYSQN